MKLSHIDFQSQFDLDSGFINVLVVENPRVFSKYCFEILDGINCDCGEFCLSDGEKILKMSKYCLFVSDLLNLETESKKLTTKLYADLKNLTETQFGVQWFNLKSEIVSLFEKLNANSFCQLEYDEEGDITPLLKAFNVRLYKDCETLLEKVVVFIKANASYLGIKQFFFVNLKCFLSENELNQLYKEAVLDGISLFLIENTCREKLEGEKIVVIDQDLCEIVV